ncbi:MAG: carbamate kinase [Chloroflexota bacterium]
MSKIAVVAVGGNSLIKDPKHQNIADQYAATVESSRHVASMIEQGWDVLLTHGNGPQVGFILRRSELSRGELHPVPLDYCGADTQGAIGYMFQRALHNEFRERGMEKQAATVITQTLVDKDDPAFTNPTKPIGSFMDHDLALEHEKDDGWSVVEDAGRGWRRVVASPLPVKIVEFDAIKALIKSGFTVIASGGGGIPVIEQDGQLVGVEAVIDKDYAAATLARDLKADLFLITTQVDKVALNFGKPDQVLLDTLTLAEAKQYLAEGHFLKGSMGPKVQAIIGFLEAGGKEALITSPENIERGLSGETGTRFTQ